jgi:N-acetylglutamate synthase-like GNAT family acetyltransferase
MNHSIEVQMLNALEFFHYSYRFQHRLFVLSLSEETDLKNIVTDLRVLNASKIKCMVVLNNRDRLSETIQEWASRGYPFQFFLHESGMEFGHKLITDLRELTEGGGIPVVGLTSRHNRHVAPEVLEKSTFDLAQNFIVDKVFFLSEWDGLKISNTFISHLTPQEAQRKMDFKSDVNIGKRTLDHFVQSNLKFGFEIVLLKGESGCLFQEIFTHRGKGTLLTSDYPNVIRKGQKSDVMDITLLLKPYVTSGAILPVTEDSIASEVEEYYVYTVNKSIVAIAKLTDHGTATELAKFCTLPRYQGKGRARELAEKMIQTVRKAKKEYLFALSIEPKMFEFFKSLGFSECDRQSLPESWKNKYDLSRESRAFRLTIG